VNKYKPLIIVIVLLIICLVVVRVVLQNITFRVSSTYPNTNNFPTSSPYIDIKVNHELAKQDITKVFSSKPNIVKSVEQKDNKNIRIKLAPLDDGRLYAITINNLKDIGGKTIQNMVIVLKAKYIPSEKLSKDLRKAVSDDQDQKQLISDPILSYLPYGGINYKLNATYNTNKSNNDVIAIDAQILLNASDVRTNKQAAINLYKQQVQDYIKSLGLDPNKYLIQYKVVEPSIY